MPEVRVYGSLAQCRERLLRIKEVIAARVAEGYPPEQHQYDYVFQTVQDDRLCPDCAPLHGSHIRGSYILGDFPGRENIDNDKMLVHLETKYHSGDKCRCELHFVNKHEALVQMLADELNAAVGWIDARTFTVVKNI